MKPIDIKQQLLPMYVLIIILLQIELTILSVFMVSLPLLLVMTAFHMRQKNLGLLGFFFLCLVALSLISLPNMEDLLLVFLELFFLIIPVVILLSMILQLDNPKIYLTVEKKPLILVVLLSMIIISVFYLVTTLSWEGFLLTPESIEGQILLLGALTFCCCTPFLLSKK